MSRSQMVKEETRQSTKQPQFYCENAEIPITEDFEMLGVTIDNKLKFEKHVSKVCRKFSQ